MGDGPLVLAARNGLGVEWEQDLGEKVDESGTRSTDTFGENGG